jgi:hypothetical protein
MSVLPGRPARVQGHVGSRARISSTAEHDRRCRREVRLRGYQRNARSELAPTRQLYGPAQFASFSPE